MHKIQTIGGYETLNANLAALLFTCGVPWKKDETGRDARMANIYTVDVLRRHGIPRGTDIFDGAKRMFNDGRGAPGMQAYYFEQTPTCVEIDKAWKEMQARIDVLRDEAGNVPSQGPIATMEMNAADAASLVCQVMSAKALINELWRTETPFITWGSAKMSPGEREHQVTVRGSFRLCSIFAGEETKRHLGIQ